MTNLKIITSTIREGNTGIRIAEWITKIAENTPDYTVELLDLAEIDLPMMTEPNHPRLKKYKFEHTKQWSRTIDAADAFIFVLGEYNYGYPAPIKNAFDYLHNEWKYKPVGFVSYGGISAGLRSTQMMKQVVTTVSMMPLAEQVNISMPSGMINEDGAFAPIEIIEQSAAVMLRELLRWSDALKTMRTEP